jgi:NADP-dependent 3-hydroxy acid dehydrogenase YdfG
MSALALAGKTAWVIGGGSGLGAAAAIALAAQGASVVVSGRRVEALDRTCARITAENGVARAELLDVTQPDAIAQSAARIGQIDILVYSSGTNVAQRALRDLSAASWTSIIDVNLNGAFQAIQSVLPGMRQRGSGTIMTIASWVGWRLEPIAGAAYSTSKHAMLALTETINIEEGPNGIRATCLCPAEADTEVLDTRPVPPHAATRARMLKAADLGAVIGFIAALPPHVCVNQIVLSPTVNRFYHPEQAAS